MATTNSRGGLKWNEYLICGVPFILIIIGGLIGGVVGGIAFAINIKIWKSNKNQNKKYTLISMTTVLAFVIGLALIALINFSLRGLS